MTRKCSGRARRGDSGEARKSDRLGGAINFPNTGTTVKVQAIRVGKRHRRDLGNIAALAASTAPPVPTAFPSMSGDI
jgi:hypothetical protein